MEGPISKQILKGTFSLWQMIKFGIYYSALSNQSMHSIIYVDDPLIAGNCSDKINQIIEKLREIFRMENLGEPKFFLG